MDNECVPLEACTFPGEIKLTPRAMEYLTRFNSNVPAGWIAAFDWYDEGRFKASKDSPWIETGPGLDLGAFRTNQIPEEAVYRSGSLRYAILIWKRIVDSYPQKTIDLDDRGNPILT